MLRRKRQPIGRGQCPFCQSGAKPDYKEADGLKAYLTERGRIVGRNRTGICAKHQRRLAQQIKRARHLALLPFVTKV